MSAGDLPVNHHADHPGFSGVMGALVGVVLLAMGRSVARLAAESTAVGPEDTVVDIGCGPGGAARVAARRGAAVIGVDPAPVMLRLARAVTRHGTIAWTTGTAESVPLPDASATVVWSLATVHHWQDVEAGLHEARRVLAPGGRLLAVERQITADATGLASHGWTRQQADAFAAQCISAGFHDVEVAGRSAGRREVWAVQAVRP
ncbi:class I SAM-dependent methyltransferase [Mycolicibacterium flavescens]|uniref:SAM-dependent methyltransferase n=1 Tax=Mycolicibacterium flavescens TaxID=1776 RepID=A0A1E3RKP4_MYCFV|nr:class I SAM-dependent methyltransferase [Mycolicibacterium flavescens]MCV7278918.1 class I SAM-dependent methyltransferase [Mycolicibacterium flavescens]ODQ90430.1 SAM-dependent methyltransferase [Mycolicibacterium flavescens]